MVVTGERPRCGSGYWERTFETGLSLVVKKAISTRREQLLVHQHLVLPWLFMEETFGSGKVVLALPDSV
jgi:hypothetical protein